MSLAHTKAVIFDLDNIFPERDYLLQVYYLFGQFIEYTEQINSGPVIKFMQDHFEKNGNTAIFDKTATEFSIPLKYRENFEQLHKTARLPLKLLLYKKVLTLLQEAGQGQKLLFLLAEGDPQMQLNKIKQIEWNGLEGAVKVYFPAEMNLTKEDAVEMLKDKYQLKSKDILWADKDI